MARIIQIRRGTTAQNDQFTGAPGEVTMDMTTKTLRVHDGETLGGTELARADNVPDMSTADYVIAFQHPTAANNYTWYRKYKSGWVEQGGIWTGEMECASGSEITPGVSLPITMATTQYHASAATINIFLFPIGQHRSNSFVTFRMGAYTVARTLTSFTWHVCGIAQP